MREREIERDTYVCVFLSCTYIVQNFLPLSLSEMLYSTQLGIATVASGLGPDDSLVVFRELQSAQRGFVLENELHIIYQVGPRRRGGIYMWTHIPVCMCMHIASCILPCYPNA